MNKVMLIVLLVCVLGCTMWLVAVNDKSNTYKKASVKSTPTETKSIIKKVTKSTIKTKINPKDGAEMVLIPAGEFLMGTSEKQLATTLLTNSAFNREFFSNEFPQHKVYQDAYYLYKTEVTVAQYRDFCRATKRKMPGEPDWKWQDNHPIVNVTWFDAKAYADWAGAVLPTEAQWEKAARGTDGRIFPWGNNWESEKCANWYNSNGEKGYILGTHPVGSFPAGASPYGVMDMAGNVWEWCADWYGADYYKNATAKNPIGPKSGEDHVLRGNSWCGKDYDCRSAYRGYNGPNYGNVVRHFGFRCASPGP